VEPHHRLAAYHIEEEDAKLLKSLGYLIIFAGTVL
jgi:hypothetical protein